MAADKNKHRIKIGIHFAVLGLFLIFAFAIAIIVLKLFNNKQKDDMSVADIKKNVEMITSVTKEKIDKNKASDSESLDNDRSLEIINAKGSTLKKRIRTPDGYKRNKADKDSLTSFLRNYPLKKDGQPVLLYDGEKKGNQDAHAAVFKLPIENENLQQCADSVMRVYAEYLWKTNQKEKISFHFVDGFKADYVKWRDGSRINVNDTGSSWVSGGTYDDSYENFKKYLRIVFAYASTLSMEGESNKIKLSQIDVGDIFLTPGSPGHVVMVVDICENDDGKKAFLLGQGYMPAQEFHLLKNTGHEQDPWYYEDEMEYPFVTPEHTFKKGSLRRPVYLLGGNR